MSDTRFPDKTLFLRTRNSARAGMAESIMSGVGAGRFKASSAGSMPGCPLDPSAINLLRRLNRETDRLRAKGWRQTSSDSPTFPTNPPPDLPSHFSSW